MFNMMRQRWQDEKGQGSTEWALVAVFAVALFFLFRDSGLLAQVKNAYDHAGSYLSSTSTLPIQKYGMMSNSELRQAVDNSSRIAMDDAALRNIAGAFLGKTRDEINVMMASAISESKFKTKYNPKGALNQGTLLFDYYIENTGEEGGVKTRFNNGVMAKDNLVNWMQGNYTDFQSKQMQLTADNRYFFSDDLIDPYGIMSGTPKQAGKYAVSVRCTFEVDKTTQKVNAVQIWATRNKEDDDNPGQWVRDVTQGVDGTMNIKVTQ